MGATALCRAKCRPRLLPFVHSRLNFKQKDIFSLVTLRLECLLGSTSENARLDQAQFSGPDCGSDVALIPGVAELTPYASAGPCQDPLAPETAQRRILKPHEIF